MSPADPDDGIYLPVETLLLDEILPMPLEQRKRPWRDKITSLQWEPDSRQPAPCRST